MSDEWLNARGWWRFGKSRRWWIWFRITWLEPLAVLVGVLGIPMLIGYAIFYG